jgi:hypothetical protein
MSRQQNEVKPTDKAETVHNHYVTVKPADVIVDIGATTVNATFDNAEGAMTKTVKVKRTAGDQVKASVAEKQMKLELL